MGFDAQQVIPPYYWRCGELEVERHYRMVAEAGDLPVVIYHNPALSKFTISPKFAGRLAAIPNIVAMKEVLTDLQHLEALYDEIAGRIEIYNTFRALLAGLMLGAAGGFINIFAVPAAAALMKSFKARRNPTRPGDSATSQPLLPARRRGDLGPSRHHQGDRDRRHRDRDGSGAATLHGAGQCRGTDQEPAA